MITALLQKFTPHQNEIMVIEGVDNENEGRYIEGVDSENEGVDNEVLPLDQKSISPMESSHHQLQ